MKARSLLLALAASSLLYGGVAAQAVVPTPRSDLGFDVGADRQLADWTQIVGYFAKLAAASPAVKLDTLGKTTLGKPFIVTTISSPENLRKIEAIRTAQAKLADPRRLTSEEEAGLVAGQPAVVLISCNIHSSEIASSQMAMELAYRLVTNDTLRQALEHTVVLLIPSMNPDGEQMITEWYRRELGTQWEGGPMPWLYHPYAGHDNNRDWYMVTQVETRLVTDLLYRKWFPEVFYDVHQMGNEGARIFVPPFVDPVNPNVDPLIVRGIGQIGAEMAMALEEHGKTGVADHVIYDLWWHGGARSTPTRHNMIGLLTEAASAKVATPVTQSAADLKGHQRGLPHYEPTVNFPHPWPGGVWRLRDIVDYELITAEALVKLAARERDSYVRNFVALGRRQVELGKTDSIKGYEIPLSQRDPSATRTLLKVLAEGGVEFVTTDSSVAIPFDQPYRAHAKDLLEIQHYPKRQRWPGGPPEPPYDVAGWTLPLQMGVTVRPLTVLPTGRRSAGPSVAMLVKGNARGGPYVDGRDTDGYRDAVRALKQHHGATLSGGRNRPRFTLSHLPRIALYKPWTANIDEGWTRWVLEQFGFPYTSVTDSVVKAGRLRDQFDVLLVPDMSLRELREGMSAKDVPPRYAGGLGAAGIGAISSFVNGGGTLVLLDHASELGVEVLHVPVRQITALQQPDDQDADSAAERGRTETEPEPLYAPGSVLRVLVDASHPVGYGMPDTAAVYFTNSVTFDVAPGSPVHVIARYPERGDDILLSGYLQGAQAIAGKAAAVEARVGRGRVVMFGFRPQHRGQSYGTFRMLFNALLTGGRVATRN
jgi:hypothetical protein